jgi:hypothetical protein
MGGPGGEELSSRLGAVTDWSDCADLDVRTLPEDQLPSWSASVHRITPTRRCQGGFALCGWECACGECERPRYADPEMAAGAAKRHLRTAS